MIEENEKEWSNIERWLAQGASFVLYRMPQDDVCHGLMQNGAVEQLEDISLLNGKAGFVFAPFRIDSKNPLLLLKPEERICFSLKAEQDFDRTITEEVSPLSESYSACFASFLQELCEGECRKLVLSRRARIGREEGFSVLRAFRAACCRFEFSYVYLFYTPETGFWLGCTPEILLSGGQGAYHTVALAGTQSLQQGELPQQWDDKNRAEQNYVTEYILSQLARKGICAEKNGPYPVRAGALAHLKTDVHFALAAGEGLGDLLKLLHPTPAVCGVPKEKAFQFILEHETTPRTYYTGFLGWLDPQGQTDLYVNLRCMQMLPDAFVLYAGGGILSSSQVEDEWQETEKKMGTMRFVVHHGYAK